MASDVTATDRERPAVSEDTPTAKSASAPTTAQDAHTQASPPKRKASEATATSSSSNNNNNTTTATTPGTENGEGKKKRRKVNHACVYCRRSHMTCDLERPCARCIKRDIGHLCHDEPREPPKRHKSEVSVTDIAPAPGEGNGNGNGKHNDVPTTNGQAGYQPAGDLTLTQVNGTAGPQLARQMSSGELHRPVPVAPSASANNLLQNFDWNNSSVQNQFQDMHHLHPNYMFNTSEVTNEYNLLNDFLSSSLVEDGGLYNADDAQALFNDPLLATSSVNALAAGMPPPSSSNAIDRSQQSQPQQHGQSSQSGLPSNIAAQVGQDITRPTSTLPIDSRARDKFYMEAADPAGLESAENRLHKLLKAKYDAGMLKPFNYVKGYARLNQYMSKHLSRESQVRVLKQLDRFRPKFREAMQSLTDMQLVLVEMWFERSLMEYDRVFASMAIPACCWRRTGEIFRGNTEMAELIRRPHDSLRDGKLAIHEIIAEDSLVSYWEKFGAIAFDQSQKAILTSCSLKRPASFAEVLKKDGQDKQEKTSVPMEAVRCCFSFTIRRDTHNIPSLIVGNFLPIQPHHDQR